MVELHAVLLLLLVLLPPAVCLVAADPSGGCKNPFSPGRTVDSFVTADGRTRSFIVYVPSSISPSTPSPLVVLMHGGLGTGAGAETNYNMNAVADQNAFITVYPDGFSKSFNAGTCCGTAMSSGVDDVLFISLLLDRLEGALCVDRARIFATGMSNGALMSHRLACELSSRIAAIAPVEGTLNVSPCTPPSGVAVLAIHGTMDLNVPVNGGVGCGVSATSFSSLPFTMDSWASSQGCTCTYAQLGSCGVPSPLTKDDATCTVFGACSPGREVVLCMIRDGGHTWSGTGGVQFALPGCNGNVGTWPASQNIWEFFAQHPKASSAGVSAGGGNTTSAAAAVPSSSGGSSTPTRSSGGSSGASSTPPGGSAEPDSSTGNAHRAASCSRVALGVTTHVLLLAGLKLGLRF